MPFKMTKLGHESHCGLSNFLITIRSQDSGSQFFLDEVRRLKEVVNVDGDPIDSLLLISGGE